MPTLTRFVPQCYRDSVSLMQFSRAWKDRLGADEASAVMATATNLALLAESGVVRGLEPRPDDLLLVLAGAQVTEDDLEQAEKDLLKPAAVATGGSEAVLPPPSVREAVRREGDLNFALISVPGDYAAAEALKALSAGLNVMLFSDNVPVEREVFLKDEAARRGLLCLGPDCGTSLVGGVPLGFANQVRRGPVGLVSASGTGLQEVASLLDRWGSGVSQALGTGGRDLKEAVGGRAALACLAVLEADPDTRVVVLVSKPPAAAVRDKLFQRLEKFSKPVVTCFIGDAHSPTLAGAARKAFSLAEGSEAPADEPASLPLPKGGRYLRGLYSGGTLCAEAAFLASQVLPGVRSNVSVPGVSSLADVWHSDGHAFVDLGEDEFTRGRPHPMIDQAPRLKRLAEDDADTTTAALLVDVVLGHGSAPDQAGELAALLPRLRCPLFVTVTGTESDPQVWSRSADLLRAAGAHVFGNNAAAVAAAVAFVKELA